MLSNEIWIDRQTNGQGTDEHSLRWSLIAVPELLQTVAMIALGLAEQRPHEAVVPINDFVDQRGAGVEYHRHQGG
ncbi:hypothetical protein [Nitrosovibrio sp. Nv6]|uniref:hypothetical protein n=1 Tax=Nitrosovibrio sp. Nv6 TaxID=1855340 RepID=UPI0008AEAD32|nr:hypothetical protein [Nitrosovibrio sp. Nv6]SEO44463.1 hypothetical protein SAMN05216316_0229 [Nitrosovibrio sp. Nv6]